MGMPQVTQILNVIEAGDPHAAEQLLPLVYDELRQLARARLAHEQPGLTLQPTALVHEAYLRLVGNTGDSSWENRGHFFAAAAEAMRRILIDQARRKHSLKRGGQAARIEFDSSVAPPAPENGTAFDLLALDEALRQFEEEDPVRAQLVKLKYFAGLSIEETAQAMGISSATAKRHWIYARAWLYGKLENR